MTEEAVARKAVELARAGAVRNEGGEGQRETHVGYYLIDKGLPELERAVEFSLTLASA